MTDLLVRNLDPLLRSELKARAARNRRSLGEEAKALMRQGLTVKEPEKGLGTLIHELFKGTGADDFVPPERTKDMKPPPDFS